ncbi:3-hydroxyacyl-CoA dehydrogenase [Rhodococcus jostii]|uniref:NAD(P)-dependent dehydrogenase, short-chain alcohol dehydrogenase family n=1 Tax=Rhodococcus jostii TaxID=132919 RepID=A0A1H4IVH5_RHOJO|nr:3-hydroxyacyl-CoA dehydrogenase [Rhodococcus jostii]SEB38074.1 NAD(P)-dependent dehydrogenase, short-chain alcohol dehydrogenase family [Rhodococcus jostii]
MQLDNQGVLVTGGASGLGLATVQRFHKAGAHVVIADLPGSPGEAVASDLGERCEFAPTDVTQETDVQQALARFGQTPLRAVVNCAGIAPPKRIIGRNGPHDLDHFRKVIEVNLIGTFNVLRLAADTMRVNELSDGDRGVIVMTASIAAFDGQIGQAAYSSSKAGVHGLTLTAARDLAEHNIRVCAVAPGIFETPMLLGLPPAAQQALGAQIPHPSRLGKPEEFAQLVEHIVENPMLNGETIRLDGAIRMPPK